MVEATIPSGVDVVLWQLFRNGPTWDGDLVSKEARTWLKKNGYTDKEDGWNFLTGPGVALALSLGMDRGKKELPQ